MHIPVGLIIAVAVPVAEPEVEAGTWRGSRCIPVRVLLVRTVTFQG